jgi:hypothetical protein
MRRRGSKKRKIDGKKGRKASATSRKRQSYQAPYPLFPMKGHSNSYVWLDLKTIMVCEPTEMISDAP